MIIQKLPWAGIRVTCGRTSVVIDPLFHFPAKFGQSHEPMIPLSEFGHADAVLITHHHGDHWDGEAIAAFYGTDIPIYLPAASLPLIDGSPFTCLQGVKLDDSFEIGDLRIAATYAVDGFGDPQVAWVVEGGGNKIIHSGDTLWHGYWWKINRRYGPFDAACLPVNGAVVALPGLKPSGMPISLTPEQAVAAADILGAKTLVPIHFRAIHHPPIYHETPDILERLQASAANRIELVVLDSGETLTLSEVIPAEQRE